MRIVHIHSDCTRTKGISRYVAALAERSAEFGQEVHYLHCRPNEIESGWVTFLRLRIISSPHFLEMMQFARVSRTVAYRMKADIIHTHGEVPFGDVVTAHSCHLRAMKIRSAKDPVRTVRNHGLVDGFRLRTERRLYKEGACRHVIAVSNGVKRELQEEYDVPASKVTVIPNGVDTQWFDPRKNSATRAATRKELGIPMEDHVLLIVANEFRRKGLHIVIDAMTMLGELKPWLLVVGRDAPTPFQIQAQNSGVSSRVRFLSRSDAIEKMYAAADLFVMPSYYEAFSLASLEAAASGLPVVITKVNGAEELIVDGSNGMFVERNADDVAMKIQTLLEAPDRLAEMGVLARQSAERFDWAIILGRVLAVYNRLLGEK